MAQRNAVLAERVLAASRALRVVAISAAVEPHDFGSPTGLGFRCTRPVAAGEVLLELPSRGAITVEWAKERVLAELGIGAAALLELTPHDFLCLWLLLERRRGKQGLDSELAEYVRQLPQDLAEMSAAFWPEDVLAELEGCEALVRLTDLKERIEGAYARVRGAVDKAGAEVQERLRECLDAEQYAWARCILISRQFEGSWCAETQEKGLLMPGADLFNHSCAMPPGECFRRGEGCAGGSLQVVALRAFAEGEEALVSYGRLGGSQLLERGFTIAENLDDSVELVLGVKCSARRLPLLLSLEASSGGPPDESGADYSEDFEWREPPKPDVDAAEARLTLRRGRPLPAALLQLVRLECLSEDELESALSAREAGGNSLAKQRGLAGELAPFGQECERETLGKLLAVSQAMQGRFGTSNDNESAASDAYRRMAIVARLGEKAALIELARATFGRLLRLLGQLEGRTPEPVGGSVWFCMLREAKPRLEQAQQSGLFAQTFQRLQSMPLGLRPSDAEALHTQACVKVFHWLHDLLRHPAGTHLPTEELLCGWAAEAGDLEYLRLYFEKLALWGRYLMAQLLCAGTFALSDMNAMQMEAMGIRGSQSPSVPTGAALSLLLGQGPLLQVGCGTGLWAEMLQQKGADVLAYDLEVPSEQQQQQHRRTIVKPGGAEKVVANAGRTLLLVWPDEGGSGSLGTTCLELYRGERLVLVGEWPDWTFGQQQSWGQSFSQELVQAVERDFELEKRVPLPCWPLALDSLMLWRRRRCAAEEATA